MSELPHGPKATFSKTRTKLNSSLKSERTKVDQSFLDESEQAAEEADKRLGASRVKADQLELRKRESVDRGIQNQHLSVDATQAELSTRTVQRAEVDEAKASERKAADLAMQNERDRLRLSAEAFFSFERKATDSDLAAERSENDREARTVLGLLEVSEAANVESRDSLATRDQHMAIVSHDLRNPLASIGLSAQLLARNGDIAKRSVLESKAIATIIHNVATMDRMITDLLDVEKIAVGKLQIAPASHSLRQLLAECVAMFEPIASKMGISLADKCGPDPLKAFFDFERMRQVLSNLLGNALKFTAKGGTIEISGSRDQNDLVISVKDNGMGMSEDGQRNIFEKFSQLANSRRQGLGLGLFISKWIIDAHGGSIKVKSSLGGGSTFTIRLPLKNSIGVAPV